MDGVADGRVAGKMTHVFGISLNCWLMAVGSLVLMLLPPYAFVTSPDISTFEFESHGPNGVVVKVVWYTLLVGSFYNLGFGDKDPVTGAVSDLTISNNGDTRRILTTVAATLYTFTDHYPYSWIIAEGSTASRTRLYKIEISNNLKQIEKDFLVLGSQDLNWESFRKNAHYDRFSVRRKL